MNDVIIEWWDSSTAKRLWDDMTPFGRILYPIFVVVTYIVMPLFFAFLFIWFLGSKGIEYISNRFNISFDNIIFKKKEYEDKSG